MARASRYKTETVKVLPSEESAITARKVITATDAARSGLPKNCVVVPMRILDHPEPIKRSGK